MRLQASEELLEDRVVVVASPVGNEAETGWPVAIAHFPKDDPGPRRHRRGFAGKRDATFAVDRTDHRAVVCFDMLDEGAISRENESAAGVYPRSDRIPCHLLRRRYPA